MVRAKRGAPSLLGQARVHAPLDMQHPRQRISNFCHSPMHRAEEAAKYKEFLG